ncbi:hypothetical protein [Nocardia carnea]|uniref:hypothetical protein n=1 Tax=Nocardia carnea TaxID=37328 RepID=UPI002455FD1F|nr:hypothetical protein [Nocardia carnea]
MTFEYPATAPAFYIQTNPGKVKLLIGDFGPHSRRLTPITTVSIDSDEEADRLVAALENAAWHGDRKAWDALAAGLPNAVALACNQALSTLPQPASLAIGSDGWPLSVVATSYFSTMNEDLRRQASASYDLSIMALIDNHRSDDGPDVGYRLRLLSGEIELPARGGSSAWPAGGQEPAERLLIGPNELDEVLIDARWQTHRARAHWFWRVECDEDGEVDTGEATWVVEFFDEPVPDDPEPDAPEEYDSFVLGEWNPWPMTSRTRFVLWQSMICLTGLLELELSVWDENEAEPDVPELIGDFPWSVQSQPRAWWVELLRSGQRLVGALRTGESWNPRTPAEEALIYMCCTGGWVDAGHDLINERGILRRQFRDLAEGVEWDADAGSSDSGPDFDWGEVPAALAGDEDIAFLWRPDLDGLENPSVDENLTLGIGDYTPSSWHVPFARYRNDPNPASALY